MKVVIYKLEQFKDSIKEISPMMRWLQEANMEQFGVTFDLDVFLTDIQRLIKDENSDLLVLMDNDKPVGWMGILRFSSPLGKQNWANEHYWYVSPEKRGMGSMMLFDAAKDWAKQKGCTHLIMNASMMASSLHDKVCTFYDRLGMKKFETSYISEIEV